jgi:TetR/AcrR family transcriptional regulator, transcriptional repressor for nem operon
LTDLSRLANKERVPGRPRSFDPDRVLDAAMALFWKRGYAATGLCDLEEATGLGRQSLYGAFGDKRALFTRVVDRYFEVVLRPHLIDVLDAPGSGRANVERVIGQWDAAAASPEFNGCLVGNSSSELSLHDPEIAELLRRKLELMENAFHRALTRAHRDGQLAPSADPRALARTLLALAQGLAVIARVNRNRAFVRAIAGEARALLG